MSWKSKIEEAMKDTTTLDVVTTTGSIKLTANDMASQGWGKIAEAVSAKIKKAELNVVAYTHTQWDCDTFMFVKSSPSDEEQKLVESHAAVVDAAHATRREAVKMMVDVLKSV